MQERKKMSINDRELHKVAISDALVADNSIALKLTTSVTMKARPEETWEKVCFYQVKNGKIISEQFFI